MQVAIDVHSNISINLSILDFKCNNSTICSCRFFPINLSILDFKLHLESGGTGYATAINLSILDFKSLM